MLFNLHFTIEDIEQRAPHRELMEGILSPTNKTTTKLLSYQDSMASAVEIELFLKKNNKYFSGNIHFNPKEVTTKEVRRRLMEVNCITTRTNTSDGNHVISAVSMFPVYLNSISTGSVAGLTVYGATLLDFKTHLGIFLNHVLTLSGSRMRRVGLFINIPENIAEEGGKYIKNTFGGEMNLKSVKSDFVLVSSTIG